MFQIMTWLATAGQTIFAVTGGYTPGTYIVTYNGVALRSGIDVDLSSGTNVVLSVGATQDAEIAFYKYDTFAVADALAKTSNLADVPNKSAARQNLGLTDFSATNVALPSVVRKMQGTPANPSSGSVAEYVDSSGNLRIKRSDGTERVAYTAEEVVAAGFAYNVPSLTLPFSGGFSRYTLRASAIQPTSLGSILGGRLSMNGSVFVNSGYRWGGHVSVEADPVTPFGASNGANFQLSGAMSGGGSHATLELDAIVEVGYNPVLEWKGGYQDNNTGKRARLEAYGAATTVSGIPAQVTLAFSSGSISTMRYTWIGHR